MDAFICQYCAGPTSRAGNSGSHHEPPAAARHRRRPATREGHELPPLSPPFCVGSSQPSSLPPGTMLLEEFLHAECSGVPKVKSSSGASSMTRNILGDLPGLVAGGRGEVRVALVGSGEAAATSKDAAPAAAGGRGVATAEAAPPPSGRLLAIATTHGGGGAHGRGGAGLGDGGGGSC